MKRIKLSTNDLEKVARLCRLCGVMNTTVIGPAEDSPEGTVICLRDPCQSTIPIVKRQLDAVERFVRLVYNANADSLDEVFMEVSEGVSDDEKMDETSSSEEMRNQSSAAVKFTERDMVSAVLFGRTLSEMNLDVAGCSVNGEISVWWSDSCGMAQDEERFCTDDIGLLGKIADLLHMNNDFDED